ncbi:hypothetical protein QBC35DRAFT_371992 [Podospora australis]|uniref:C2H2-type domain-containing protein n=1 Tax=Podospora australis TaxID=1536484 RepID=A0AAN6X3W6_9PEZI|nr:hypothetical protein QBC35DRAFT_371992 [Podospora australis]
MYPSSVPDNANRRGRIDEPRNLNTIRDTQLQQQQQYQTQQQQHTHYIGPSTPGHSGHLSAYSPQPPSTSPSPSVNAHTPAESVLSVHYQSSELSEADELFYGVNFDSFGDLSPSFLGDEFALSDNKALADPSASEVFDPLSAQHARQDSAYLPLSPDKTPSLSTTSPKAEGKSEHATFPDLSQTSIAPHQLSGLIQSSFGSESHQSGLQLTPKTSNSENSSDNGLAPAAAIMHSQSPRVTVSHWDQDNDEGLYGSDENQHSAADIAPFAPVRDTAGRWVPDQTTGQSGLDPAHRTSSEVTSVNDMAKNREVAQKNRKVDSWLQKHQAKLEEANKELPTVVPNDGEDNIPDREIEIGAQTENVPKPGQTYYQETGGEFTQTDREIMHQNRNWGDAPLPFHISDTRYQPQTSQAAIEKYSRQCRDNDSVVSRAATWGTRRRSLPSIFDIDVQATGNFLKKLSLTNRGEGRRPSLLGGLRGLVRKPSVNMSKRARGDFDDASSGGTDSSLDRRDSQTKLAPPSPTPGWNRKNSVPSINTAFVAMGSSVAAIGTTHARSGSLSATPITSPTPKSPSTLGVKRPLMNRLRSKSENQAPGIVDMWKKTGGPPVSNLGNTRGDPDDDDDDDDDLFEDSEMKEESNKLIDDITPNFAGFQQHVLKLNPQLSTTNNFLVDRIAHQQIVRYKGLLNAKVKHLQATAARNCSCGTMCIALGGSANFLDSKGDLRGADPLSAKFDGSDGDITPLEGAINQESFPQDIPMPPTSTLPAEFECQLCYTAKKFQKPSDWTKHVHEDVQPFTCTWERCRDPKIFKRKADWVRHENEGHRHLEWWTCDVEDCRHICYRRDNFLQHLVREHKFPEPKVKTKAAIKRAGGNDPTWQKVEVCHQETRVQPQEEPCRFCGKTFPTWKKLTVHLAKHMEQISLPILKLVARKELDEDTIISPVQEPPPRQFPATFPTRPQQYDRSPTMPHGSMVRQPGPMPYPSNTQQFLYQPVVPSNYNAPLPYNTFDDLTQSMAQTRMNMQPVSHPVSGFTTLNTQAFSGLPVTTSPYMTTPTNPYVSAPDIEPFPAMNMNALGLQDPNAPVHMSYANSMLDIHGAGDLNQYTPQGSVSPFSHSPHQPQGGFYSQ